VKTHHQQIKYIKNKNNRAQQVGRFRARRIARHLLFIILIDGPELGMPDFLDFFLDFVKNLDVIQKKNVAQPSGRLDETSGC
jgi:hypothetical protein